MESRVSIKWRLDQSIVNDDSYPHGQHFLLHAWARPSVSIYPANPTMMLKQVNKLLRTLKSLGCLGDKGSHFEKKKGHGRGKTVLRILRSNPLHMKIGDGNTFVSFTPNCIDLSHFGLCSVGTHVLSYLHFHERTPIV